MTVDSGVDPRGIMGAVSALDDLGVRLPVLAAPMAGGLSLIHI